jgi:ribose transport system ATP-binding protein
MAGFLEMTGIGKRFGATVALAGVDLAVDEGEVLSLVGENGSGKSTLMRILAGAIRADAGTMALAGKPYRPRNTLDARRRGIGMIHQELSLCGHLSVVENVLLGMEATHVGVLDRREMKSRAQSALATLGYGGLSLDMLAKDLPIAACQIVEIARAIAVGCRVLVLDEPTSSLTESDAKKLFQVVGALRSQGHAIIYISHFLDEVYTVSDSVAVLRDGKLVGRAPIGDVTQDEMVAMMVGRKIESMYPRSDRPIGDVVLEIADLSGISKPVGASLELRQGEVLGLAGLNGSGRTELLRAIFGLDRVRSGRIRLGTFLGRGSPARRWRQGAGLLSEDRKLEGLAVGMSIADNVTLSSMDRLGRMGVVRPTLQAKATNRWIGELDIRCQGPWQKVGDLSGGNQQKVAIARLLQHDVDVLLLDEPTRGIDVGSKEMIYRLIDQAALSGKSVLMVSSYLPELMGVCDRIAVMHKGQLGTPRPVEETNEHEVMKEATG